VAVSGTYAYVADAYPFQGGLHIIDVSDPAHPRRVGFYGTGGATSDVVVVGNYAYITAGSYLRIIDVSTPSNPTQVGSATMSGIARGLTVSGNFAYVAWGYGLQIWFVANPEFPVWQGGYPEIEEHYDVAVAGDYAYVAAWDKGVRVVDVSDPTHLSRVGFYNTPGYANGVIVARGIVYVADTGGGLIILWFAPAATSFISPDGGTVTSAADSTTYVFPSGAFTDTVVITHTPRYAGNVPSPGSMTGIGHFFDVTAVYSSTGQPASLAPDQTYTLTVHYADAEKGPAIENTLAFYYWDGSQWVKEASSTVDTAANTVTAYPNHFSLWAVLGETRQVFLPLVLRNYP